tara:strand:- start:4218 stop:6959 length:2742 start_codon:yes stop_codon:yes gene_type:complete
MKKLALTFIFLFISLFSSNGSSRELILKDGKDSYSVGMFLDILEDKTNKLTIHDVSNPQWSSKFKESKEEIINFGFSNSSFWARLKINNTSSSEFKWYLLQNFVLQDKINLYYKENNEWKEKFTGDSIAFSKRKIKLRDLAFEINPKKETTYFIRVKGVANKFNLKVERLKVHLIEKTRENFIYGLFFGLVLTLVIYNLFIFISTKSLSYLFYSLYASSMGITIGTFEGYSQMFLFQNIPWMGNNGFCLMAGVTLVFLYLFTVNFLSLKSSRPKIYKIANFIPTLGIIIILLSVFAPYEIGIKFMVGSMVVSIPTILIIGLFRTKDYRPARYFILAFSFVLLGVMIITLEILKVLPSSFFTRNAFIIGNSFEMILLSMGLADRFNFIQEVSLIREEEAKILQANYAKTLEDEVAKKTYQLEIENMNIEHMVEITYQQKKDRDLLLGNLNQGYLTFNSHGVIHLGATKVTEDLLQADLQDSEERETKVWDVLFKKVDIDKETFINWVNKVFQAKLAFKDLKTLAPKFFKGSKDKFIELEFRPIYKENSNREVDRLILIASDKTQEIELKRQLKQDEEDIRFMNKSLQRPLEFVDLIFDSEGLIQEYKNIKDSKIIESNEEKGELYRKFHTLKARLGQFSLKALTLSINKIETEISKAKPIKQSVDNEVYQFEIDLNNFVKKNKLIVEAANKFLVDEGSAIQATEVYTKAKEFNVQNNFLNFIKTNYILSDLKEKFYRYKDLVDEIAESQGKSLDFIISGDNIQVNSQSYSDFVNSMIHIFRNMIDHGIESEEEREIKDKPRKGTVKAHFQLNSEDFLITLEDDGRGIDPQVIKEKILGKKLKSEADIQRMNDLEIINLIFLAGFSTKSSVSLISGRGVGMEVVKKEIEKLGGEIKLTSLVDKGTQFKINLPLFR